MTRVYKYKLEVARVQEITMPESAEILAVGEQDGELCLWALVDIRPDRAEETQKVLVVGTGHDMGESVDDLLHIDTVLMQNGLVFHVFLTD